jgi:flavin reductase (DIM6/NTAB) family NADH-FMN oxidoreductase RutF
MVWGITRWFSQDVCGGNCKCAKPLINGIDCFFTAAPCIDYIKGYDAGFLWNRPVAFIFIRPERYTFDFIEQNDYLTLSFLGEEHKEIHKICGSKSGRDMDKVKATGLSPLFTENGSITFEQARLTFECKKLYADLIKPGNFIDKSITDRWYGESHGGFHKMYVVEIVNVLSR